MKICSGCHKELSEDSFSYRSNGVLYKKCKTCRWAVTKKRLASDPVSLNNQKAYQKQWYEANKDRLSEVRKSRRERTGDGKWHYLWNVYRLRPETYLEIFNSQSGKCAICNEKKRLYVDHDHSCCAGHLSCGQCIRGLLCQKCNMFMHYIDEYDMFERAKKHSTARVSNPNRRG